MAHEVNQSERDIAAQVRSALVHRISAERLELWIPPDTAWNFQQGVLTLAFTEDFACQLCRKMLLKEISSALVEAVGPDHQDIQFVVRKAKTMSLFEQESEATDVDSSAPVPRTARASSTTAADRSASPALRNRRVPVQAKALTENLFDADVPTLTDVVADRSITTTMDIPSLSPVELASLQQSVDRQLQAESRKPQPNQSLASSLLELKQNGDSRVETNLQHEAVSSRIVPSIAANFSGNERSNVVAEQSSSANSRPASVDQTQAPLWNTVLSGDSNQLAWTAAKMVLSEPGRMTPVLLHGPTGTGKSMLLSAMVQRMRGELRMRRVVHMTSEQFTNDFTEGLQGGGLPMFRRKYRDVDALFLDDIQFLIGKRSTLAEVRHTIDNLLRAGKQVVLTADRSLTELTALGDELVGRLRGGLVTPLFPLDEKIRLSLLKQQTQAAGISIDAEALVQLAHRVAGDGRLIRGLVNRLKAVFALRGDKIEWDQCWTAVMDLVQATQPVVRLVDIERAVCNMFGLQADSLQSNSKMRSVSQPRMLAMFLARKYTPAAYKEIGDYFGQRRHSTVISAEKTVSTWLTENTLLEGTRNLSVREAIRYVEAQLQVG